MTNTMTPIISLDHRLADRFLAGEVPASVFGETNWGPNGKVVFDRTYSRPLFKADGTRQRWTMGDTEGRTHENWAEMCRRVVLGNTLLSEETLLPNEQRELFLAMLRMEIIPAGRHLWVDGTGFAWTRNCFSAPLGKRTSSHFKFLGSRLFEGGGVGGNYSNDLLAKTDPIQSKISVMVTCDESHDDFDAVLAMANGNWVDRDVARSLGTVEGFGARHLRELSDTHDVVRLVNVPDTREGWVAQWEAMVDAATGDQSVLFVFDVSDVRPYGAPLVTYGGKASGPEPLVRSMLEFELVLQAAVGRRLTSMDLMILDHSIAESVVAGGTRRSARLSAKYWADDDIDLFIQSKHDDSMFWSTNISVEIDDEFENAYYDRNHPMHGHARKVMDMVVEGMHLNGEPGFINSSRLSEGERTRIRITNPCSEIPLETEGSEYGEACNIGSVNLDKVSTDVEHGEYLFGLLARFLYRSTLMPYPDKGASMIEARNRRIGAGFMGLQEWALHHGVRYTDMPGSSELTEALYRFRKAVRKAADELADQLGTPRSIKVTAVAPNGSISKLPGVAAGVHPVLAKYAEQRIRFSSKDTTLLEMAAKGYPIEQCVYSGSTKVVTIPTRDAIMDKGFDEALIQGANEVSPHDFFAVEMWVTDTFCGGNDGNAVSATANIDPNMDRGELEDALLTSIFRLKGTTVFPNKTRVQQPITVISKEEYEALVEQCESVSSSLSDDCSTGACPVR